MIGWHCSGGGGGIGGTLALCDDSSAGGGFLGRGWTGGCHDWCVCLAAAGGREGRTNCVIGLDDSSEELTLKVGASNCILALCNCA